MRCLLGLFMVASVCAVDPLFTQNELYAVYTSAGIAKQGKWSEEPQGPLFASATWLNEPIFTELWNSTGDLQWSFQSTNTSAMFDVSVARHADSDSAGPVQMAVLESFLFGGPCILRGFLGTGGQGVPAWGYKLHNCSANEITGQEGSSLEISDDGSTVAIAVWSTFNGTGVPSVNKTAQLHVLDAQTGKLLFWRFGDLGQLHVTISRHGEYIGFTAGSLYVYLRNGTLRTDPMEVPGLTYMCPMGYFLISGSVSGELYSWDDNTSTYKNVFTVPGVDPAGNQWYLYSAVISTNGGGGAPDGCLMALAWIDEYAITVRVDVYSVLTYKNYWSWTSFTNAEYQTVPQIAMHMGYIAMAQWGGIDAAGNVNPNIALWNITSNETVFEYVTPGSMFAVEILVNNAPPPPYKRGAGPSEVYVMASGKHVPASVMGNGGDAFAFKFLL